jgi:hypothetical protein
MNEFEQAYSAPQERQPIEQPAQPSNPMQAYSNVNKANGYGKKNKKFNSKTDIIEPEEVNVESLIRFARTFAAISEKEIPKELLPNIDLIVEELESKKFTMRVDYSNRNPLGTELASRYGNQAAFLPFGEFGGGPKDAEISFPTEKAHKIALGMEIDKVKLIHERMKKPFNQTDFMDDYNAQRNFFKLLNAQRAHIFFGKECDTALNLMIIYTESGVETPDKLDFKKDGYTISDTVKYCSDFAIPVFNLKNDDVVTRIREFLNTFN